MKTFLTDDYLIRLINQALAAMAQIVGLKTAGMYLEAQTIADRMLEQLFGLRSDLIKRLDDENLVASLKYQDVLDTDRLTIAADLFKEKGEIMGAQGNISESYWNYLRALNFYLEVALAGGPKNVNVPSPTENIAILVKLLGPFELPAETHYSLYVYYEQEGQFARGEEILAKMIQDPELHDEMLAECAGFYRRLLDKSEAELIQGGLTKAGVLEKLAKIQN